MKFLFLLTFFRSYLVYIWKISFCPSLSRFTTATDLIHMVGSPETLKQNRPPGPTTRESWIPSNVYQKEFEHQVCDNLFMVFLHHWIIWTVSIPCFRVFDSTIRWSTYSSSRSIPRPEPLPPVS